MANKLVISIFSLSFLFFLHCCIARDQSQQQGECQIQKLKAQQPTRSLRSEGGVTEYWNSDDQQFQCAGVATSRHTIQRRGMLLPSYTSSPLMIFIEKGRGIQGVLFPACPETFQSSQQELSGQEKGQRSKDRHQKIRHLREGDVVVLPAGVAHWVYNNGEEDLVAVVMHHITNYANQLDTNPRRFYIAGNPQAQQEQQEQQGQQQQQESGNVFRGFDVQTLKESFNVDEETARKLQGENDNRGHIIKVERGLQVTIPPLTREEERQRQGQGQGQGGGDNNGLEETICSARLGENLNDPERADIYNPNAGRLSTLNSYNLPILSVLRLSAERGVLHKNAIVAPHWNLNAHSVVYATRGDARIQIVDNRGQSVFNEKLEEGQIVVVPQNFAVVIQAGNQGFNWVAFKTNDNAMVSTLAGRTSAFRGLPADVLANAYRISREEAQKLKYNRQETILFSSQRRRSSDGGNIVDLLKDVIIRQV